LIAETTLTMKKLVKKALKDHILVLLTPVQDFKSLELVLDSEAMEFKALVKVFQA
jgi:hypothetical protein